MGSGRSRFFERLSGPLRLDMPGIGQAIIDSVEQILAGNLTYRDYRTAVTIVSDLRALPLFYLLDQRIRPRPMSVSSVGDIEHHLGRFLSVDPHPGAQRLVSEALALDPSNDAARLARFVAVSPGFVRYCLEGRLGLAIKTIPDAGWPGRERHLALKLIADLLVYHGAFEAQLVAAGAWNIDNLFLALEWRAGRYDQNSALNDLEIVAETIRDIADYMLGGRPRHPNSNLVSSLRAQAKRWRDDLDGNDAKLRRELQDFYATIDPDMAQFEFEIRRRKKRLKSPKGQPLGTSIYQGYFGSTANEALYFSVTGLCQLREAALEMVTAIAEQDGRRAWSAWTSRVILLENVQRAKLIYAIRATLIRDPKGPKLEDNAGRPVDLYEAFYSQLNHADNPRLPGKNLIDHAHATMRGFAFERRPVLRGKLEGVRRFDIIPEFLLQFRMLPSASKTEVSTLRRAINAGEINRKRLDERRRHLPSPAYPAPKKAPRP